VVLTLAAACTGSSHQGAGGTVAASSLPPPSTATSGPPSAEYTKPPSRNLTRPPGVAPIPAPTCTDAQIDIHIFGASWSANQVKPVTAGRPVPDAVWAETARVTGGYHTGIAKSRSRLRTAGVPASFVVFRDLDDADAAISEAVEAANAKDDSKVISIYVKARTAEDHLVESCAALE
jgi:hypothetical protein